MTETNHDESYVDSLGINKPEIMSYLNNPLNISETFSLIPSDKITVIYKGKVLTYIYFNQSSMNPEPIFEGQQSYERTTMKCPHDD